MDSKFRLVADCGQHATIGRAIRNAFGTVLQSPILFFKPVYTKTKRQDKLRLKAFPCFFIGPSENRSRDAYEVLLNVGGVFHSRDVVWKRLLRPSVPVSAENMRSRKEGKLDPSRHGVVKGDEDVDYDEPSESTGVRSRVTVRLVDPTPVAVPCGRTTLADGRATATATSLRDIAMREIPGTPVLLCTGTPRVFAMSTSPVTSAGVNAFGDNASPGASVESSPHVSEEDEVDDSPSPELSGRAARELRWLGETLVVWQRWTREEQRQLDLDSATLLVEEALATEELQK